MWYPTLVLALNGLLLLGVAQSLVYALKARAEFSFGRRFWLLIFGALAGAACLLLEHWLGQWTRATEQARRTDELTAILGLLLFAAPLEEGAKVLFVRVLGRSRQGLVRATLPLTAVWIAAGFAVGESILWYVTQGTLAYWPVLLVGSLTHLFFAATWGVALGDYSRLWGIVWLLAAGFHGLFDHLLATSQGRAWVLTIPVILSAAGVVWLGLRDLRRRPRLLVIPAQRDSRSSFRVRQRERTHLQWIVGGAFVTTGVVIAALAFAIYLGHRLGIDFALADEADMRANGPIVLLTSALAVSFPFAGFLVARASGTSSVIEPAMGAALAIAAVVVLLSVTAPVAVIFAMAVAPLAFGLACAGAWFGVSR